MNRLLKFTGGLLLAVALIVGTPLKHAKAQPNVSVSFQTFYNSLQPYGQWIDYPQYGYVWVPSVGNDFRPYYTNGYWAMTEYGNTWVSNYNWGWAPFHYGNWTYDDYYGWIWIPGNTWAPAHVSWRNGGGYYGWAPIAPGISINVAVGNYNCGADWWVFVPQRHIYARSLGGYWRGPRYNTTIINQTTIINNTYINNNQRYVYGPRANEIQRATGQRVRTYNVRTNNSPGRSQVRGNTLNVYRPQVERSNNARPQRVAQADPQVRENRNVATRSQSPRTNAPTQRTRTNEPAQRAQTPAREYNSRPARSTPQQQERITERRQESWQNRNTPQRAEPQRTQPQRSEPQRAQPQRSEPQRAQPQRSQPQRSNQSYNRQQNNNMQRSRPQQYQRSAPQRSQPAQRSAQPQRSMQRSQPAQRSAPAQRSSPARSNESRGGGRDR